MARTRAVDAMAPAEILLSTLDKHAIVSVTDTAGRILHANDQLCRISGYSREELLGQDHCIVNSGYHPRSFWVALWRTIASGRTWHGDIRNRAKDGSIYWVDCTIAPVMGADGRVEKYVSIRNDITARNQAAELAHQLGRLLQSSFNEIYVFDARSLHFLQVSEGAKKNLGYTTEELIQLTPLSLKPLFTKEKFEEMIGPLQRGEQELLLFETIHQRKDGTTYPVEIRLQLMQGDSPSFMAIVQDITERKRSLDELARTNELLHRTGTIARIGGSEVELPSMRVTLSEEVHRILEVEPGTALTFERCVSFCAPGARELVFGALQQSMTDGSSWEIEVPVITLRGRSIWVRAICEPEMRDGAVVRLTGAIQDITEQHEVREELARRAAEMERLRDAAEAANHAKSEFLANMSHEIRTPLTAILGYAELLRDDGDRSKAPDRRLQAVDTILSAGEHLLTIINDVLDLSKIEAGKTVIETVETPLVKLLVEVESLMSSRSAEKGLTLRVALASPLPDRALTDPTRLRQILMNLVGNAIKFTQEGSVTMSARREDHETGSKLVIDVDDTGLGIPPEQAERIFSAFGQADSTVTRQHGGTGLGLTITRRFARLMGGDVELMQGALERGSRFRVQLPLRPAEGATDVSRLDGDNAATKPPARSDTVSLPGRILVAEDSLVNQRLISILLAKAGAEVDVAANGLIAFEMIEEAAANGKPYQLLLTDMQMPVMDGYSLARSLRENGSTLPIVALTAHAMAEDRQRCLEAGCDDYAGKPIQKAALLSTCEKWIGRAVAGDLHSGLRQRG